MARINLITRHHNSNNGAFLQTYATLKALETAGHQVTLIDFIANPSPSATCVNTMLHRLLEFSVHHRFSKLQKRFYKRRTPRMQAKIDFEQLPEADYTVSGSDQVWNPIITGEAYLTYFLNFAPKNTRRVSLASSFGCTEFAGTSEMSQQVKQELEKFSAISVREKSGVRICRESFGVEATQLIDPTLLFDDYSAICGKIEPYNEVCAFLFNQNTPYYPEIIRSVSASLNLPAVMLNRQRYGKRTFLGKRDPYHGIACHNLSGKVAPMEWLQHIGGSKFVITNSFHGIALSIIHRRNFIALCADTRKFERIASLLSLFHLEERAVLSLEEYQTRREQLLKPVVYGNEFEEILNEERKRYFDFIRQNIK